MNQAPADGRRSVRRRPGARDTAEPTEARPPRAWPSPAGGPPSPRAPPRRVHHGVRRNLMRAVLARGSHGPGPIPERRRRAAARGSAAHCQVATSTEGSRRQAGESRLTGRAQCGGRRRGGRPGLGAPLPAADKRRAAVEEASCRPPTRSLPVPAEVRGPSIAKQRATAPARNPSRCRQLAVPASPPLLR